MANVQLPTELYTTKSLYSLGGSSAGVWLFTTVLAVVFNIDTEKYKWIGLTVAIVLSLIGAFRVRKISVSLFTIAFFNGLLIYVTAVGIDSINQGLAKNRNEVSATLIPLTNLPWWPSLTLVDSVVVLNKRYVEVYERNNQLSERNNILKDSVILLKNTMATKSGGEEENELALCIAENSKLRTKNAELILQAAQRKPEKVGPSEATVLTANKETVLLLRKMRSMNTDLMKDVTDFLNAGELDPKKQLVAIRNAYERAFSLRNGIDDYNDKIDELLKSLK